MGLFSWEERRLRGDLLSGVIRKMERDFLPRRVVTGQGAVVLNCQRVGSDWT